MSSLIESAFRLAGLRKRTCASRGRRGRRRRRRIH
jgi:hypothetical protein